MNGYCIWINKTRSRRNPYVECYIHLLIHCFILSHIPNIANWPLISFHPQKSRYSIKRPTIHTHPEGNEPSIQPYLPHPDTTHAKPWLYVEFLIKCKIYNKQIRIYSFWFPNNSSSSLFARIFYQQKKNINWALRNQNTR